MTSILKANDLVRIALRRGIKCSAFYNEVLDNTTSPEVKAFLQDLLKERETHKNFHKKILKDMRGSVDFDEDSHESHSYIDELIESSVQIPVLSREEMSDIDAVLQHTIHVDRDGVNFYCKLKNHISAELHDVVANAFKEEQRHLSSDIVTAINFLIKRGENSQPFHTALQAHVAKTQENSQLDELIKLRDQLCKNHEDVMQL